MTYRPSEIEGKWQEFWSREKVFAAEKESKKPKYYVLDMFPYPSSSGLHVGHPEGYTATDIVARYKRAAGFNVLHPMGWDAFGLPAEQYALQTGIHPEKTTYAAIDTFRRQLQALGFSYDWDREFATCDPKYYKWTQYLFLKLHEKGLAYQREVPVNWCPELKTVLANEEVVDGKSERGGHPVFRVPMTQWMLKITDYAERLLEGLDRIDWPEGTKELQRNWIGRSEGLEVDFKVEGLEEFIRIFTTRHDTLFGATYLVLAPEHPLVSQVTTSEQKEKVQNYVTEASQKSDIARQEDLREKTGVFTGGYAVNPVNNEKIPIWVADYVLMGYGTGAIMAVPAHDTRDFEFATRFKLPIRKVIRFEGETSEQDNDVSQCSTGNGIAIHSGFLDSLSTEEAKTKVANWIEEKGLGQKSIQYRLRDWLFSRQRYWGEPFPILNTGEGKKKPLTLNELPVTLPKVESYEPSETGESPLAGIKEWVETTDPETGKKAFRETDTMPGSAASSWYFLRFCDPHNEEQFCSPEAEKQWMPVDLYIGGPEHAVGHLLYSRFWTKVFFDAGMITHDEPFQKLVHQGMILGEDGEKMSKSRGNVINPDHVIEKYGADTLRIYEMFMGPLEKDKPWSTAAIEGVYRFLQRFWRLYLEETKDGGLELKVTQDAPDPDDLKVLHQTIRKVTQDIEHLRMNTAISQMMIFVNHYTPKKTRSAQILRPMIQLIHPFAPHIAEELWSQMGEKSLLSYESWPQFDPELAKDDLKTIAIQVMGKTRGTVQVAAGADQNAVEQEARKLASVQQQIEGKPIKRVIFVKDRILNFIVQS